MEKLKIYSFQVTACDVDQIFDSGQTFRWQKIGDRTYSGIVAGEWVSVHQDGACLTISGTRQPEEFWRRYFDLDTDYGAIMTELAAIDQELIPVMRYGSGIRLLRQEPWELIVTFIISANNNIPRIGKAIGCLSQQFGKRIEGPSDEGVLGEHFSFPSAAALAKAEVADLRACGLGYRDKYVRSTAQAVAGGDFDIEALARVSQEEAKARLLSLAGVGSKVADCILLFGTPHRQVFPTDTWVKKAVQHFYLPECDTIKEIEAYAAQRFGHLAGYAQQYLFYYARAHRL